MNRIRKQLGFLRRRGPAILMAVLLAGESLAAVRVQAGELAAQLGGAVTLAEQDLSVNGTAVRILVQTCLDTLPADHPAAATLQSILVLLDTGSATGESVAALLRAAMEMDQPESGTDPAGGGAAEGAAVPTMAAGPEAGESAGSQMLENTPLGDSPFAGTGIPVYETAAFDQTNIPESVWVNVPDGWGNNASGRALVSYSPVNDSGAISPSAGTLTLSYYPMEHATEEEEYNSYVKNIADMSVTTAINSEEIVAAGLPACRVDFTMTVGANQFICEAICFAYDRTVYAIELMQGQQTEFDYFPVYQQVVSSAEIGAAPAQQQSAPETQSNAEVPETQNVPESTAAQPEPQTTPESSPEPEPQPSPEPQGSVQFAGDMSSFQYRIGANTYQFPTPVAELAQDDLSLDRQIRLPYDFSSDADMNGGRWNELVNTQYYYFENSRYKEMIGVTNINGYPSPITEGVLTALIDTQGTYIDITLPGDIRVGSRESDLTRGFPAFAKLTMDGTAAFVGNELLYACNVRDDGCNGYVLIRNDAPYYSAVSIICEEGIVKEISFECLGSVRAEGVFLP